MANSKARGPEVAPARAGGNREAAPAEDFELLAAQVSVPGAPAIPDIVVRQIDPFCTSPDISIKDAIARIDRNGEGLALVVDPRRKLIGTVTDGDIRRAILRGVDLNAQIGALFDGGYPRLHERPITASYGTPAVQLLRLMGETGVRHVPMTDETGRLVALSLLSRFVRGRDLPLRAVIMAGGLGKRLRPLTEDTPKPMLRVGDRPLLQRTIENLRGAGIRNINVTTHFQAEKIKEYVGDGSTFDAVVNYSHEHEPLGTAGALRQMRSDDGEPSLVINGDILTTVNYAAMLEYHREHRADLTVGVRHYTMKVPYGVVDCDGPLIRAIREKPSVGLFVNAGIYLLENTVCDYVPDGKRFDMTDLIGVLIAVDRRVVSFPIHEYWLDIGRHDDFERAQLDIASGKLGA